MPTVETAVKSYLATFCMLPSQINDVLPIIKDEMSTSFSNWDSLESGYDPMLINLVKLNVREITYNWLKKHHPKAWFLEVFEIKVTSTEIKIDKDGKRK